MHYQKFTPALAHVSGGQLPGAGKGRFTTGLDDQDQWHEVGDFARDGTQ